MSKFLFGVRQGVFDRASFVKARMNDNGEPGGLVVVYSDPGMKKPIPNPFPVIDGENVFYCNEDELFITSMTDHKSYKVERQPEYIDKRDLIRFIGMSVDSDGGVDVIKLLELLKAR